MALGRYIITILLLHISVPCWAQQSDGADKAKAALRQMHNYIREAKELEFTTRFRAVDKVLGQNATGSVHDMVRQPNLLRVTAKLPSGTVVVVSDGTTLTIHEPNKRRYREFEAKDSAVGSLYIAAGLLGTQTRLIDFFWSIDYLSVDRTGGRIGTLDTKTFGSKTCDGFRVQRDLEFWDVWLERSSARLPCYVVSKTTDGSASMTQTNELTWKSNPQFKEDTFRFVAPSGHKKE